MRQMLRGDDGANAVEFALVLPLLIMLIFGGITAGLTLNSRQQLDHAVRESARFAATLSASTGCTSSADWFTCVRDRAIVTSVGLLDGASTICVARKTSAGPWESKTFPSPPVAPAASPCFAESITLDGARVQVRAVTKGRVNAVLFRTALFDISSRSISAWETAP